MGMTTKVLSPGSVSTLTPEQLEYVQAWRAQALEIMPYMASVLFSFRPVNSTFVETYACDAQYRLYINFENVMGMGARFNAEAWLHEASHILAGHHDLSRQAGIKGEDLRLWNFAADAAINDDLRDAGCDELAGYGVFASSFGEADYKSALHYYGVVKSKQRQAQSRNQSKPKPQDSGDGSGDSSGDSSGAGSSGGQQSEPLFRGCGSGSGGEAAPGELGEGDLGGAAAPVDPMEHERVLISTSAAAKEYAKSHGIGSVPAPLLTELDYQAQPSTTPWQRVTAAFARRCVMRTAGKVNSTYNRRNRRNMTQQFVRADGSVSKIIVPGWEKPVPTIHFFRDVSASVRDQSLGVVNDEIVGIARRLGIKGDQLVVLDIDTKVHSKTKFRNAADLKKVHARGGTDMCEAIRYACEERRLPSCIIIATDGETAWPAEKPRVPVIVLLVNASRHSINNVPSWATKVIVEDPK